MPTDYAAHVNIRLFSHGPNLHTHISIHTCIHYHIHTGTWQPVTMATVQVSSRQQTTPCKFRGQRTHYRAPVHSWTYLATLWNWGKWCILSKHARRTPGVLSLNVSLSLIWNVSHKGICGWNGRPCWLEQVFWPIYLAQLSTTQVLAATPQPELISPMPPW